MSSLFIGLALASPQVTASSVGSGSVKKRLAADPADVVLLYAGEQDGSMGTCGCTVSPRGSLARLHGYVDAVRKTGDPVVLVNAGNWLSDRIGSTNTLREDVVVGNAHMVSAIEAGGWSGLNVGFRDLPYLGSLEQFPAGAVSANVTGPPPFVVVEAGELKIAITGVTSWKRSFLQPKDAENIDPVEALEALLPEMEQAADLVVVLGYALGPEAKKIAELDIDVLVEADAFRTRFDPILRGDTVWVRSNQETQRLGELRLQVTDGVITAAHDRYISLDDELPEPAEWRKRERKALAAIRRQKTQ